MFHKYSEKLLHREKPFLLSYKDTYLYWRLVMVNAIQMSQMYEVDGGLSLLYHFI